MTKTISTSLSFAALCVATDKALEVALASATAEQLNDIFASGARDVGGDGAKAEGKVATLAIVAGYMVDIDDAGKVDAEQRDNCRVTFQRELAIGWLMAGNPRLGRAAMDEATARKQLEDMTELGKKARAHAQSNWARVLDKAELRDPETPEEQAKREASAAKKTATKEAKKADAARVKADEATATADAAQTALVQTIAPTADAPKSDAPQALTVEPTPTAIRAALALLTADQLLATVTASCEDMARAGSGSPVTDAALKVMVATGAQWRKDRDAELAYNPADALKAELAAVAKELAELKAAKNEAAHGPAKKAVKAKVA